MGTVVGGAGESLGWYVIAGFEVSTGTEGRVGSGGTGGAAVGCGVVGAAVGSAARILNFADLKVGGKRPPPSCNSAR